LNCTLTDTNAQFPTEERLTKMFQQLPISADPGENWFSWSGRLDDVMLLNSQSCSAHLGLTGRASEEAN
jgi:hypothetical protein